jgi:hypothetical protein
VRGILAVPQAEAVVVFGRKHHIFASGGLGHVGPLPAIQIVGMEKVLVVKRRSPFAGNAHAIIAAAFVKRRHVEMNEHAEFHAHIIILHLRQ